MLIRKDIWDLSNCQKPIKGKVTIAGSLPESCSTFSGWVGLSHELLRLGFHFNHSLLSLCWFSCLVTHWRVAKGRLWGLMVRPDTAGLCRDKHLSVLPGAGSSLSLEGWDVILCLCTYGPNGNFSIAELEVQAVCPTYCMSKLDIILFLSSPKQASPQWHEIFQSKIDVCVYKAILLSKYIVWPHIFIIYNKGGWLSPLIQ